MNSVVLRSLLALYFLTSLFLPINSAEAKQNETTLLSAHSSDPVEKEGYQLKAGDRVTVKIFPADEYIRGGEYQLGPSGSIIMPLVGKIKVEGMTISEASRHVAKVIDKDYLVNPEIILEVTSQGIKSSYTILGQVRSAGTFDFPLDTKKFTLLKAISQSGGFTAVANIKKVKIIRNQNGENQVLRINAEDIIKGKKQDVLIYPDDTIHVSESFF